MYIMSNNMKVGNESMFKDTKAYSGFSVDDVQKAKKFYSQILGLEDQHLHSGPVCSDL
jgi:predicted enzyme related to lactoylglutathione lyase